MSSVAQPKWSKTLIKKTYYKQGYEIRVEDVREGSVYEPVRMYSGYSPSGLYLGDAKTAHRLVKKFGIRLFEYNKNVPEGVGPVANIGFNPEKKIWYGWSHRAICGFRMGDKIFNEKMGDDKTPYRQHGLVEITSLEDMRESATRFAEHVR